MLRKFDINSLYICPSHLYTVVTLPWEIKKVIFQQYYYGRPIWNRADHHIFILWFLSSIYLLSFFLD